MTQTIGNLTGYKVKLVALDERKHLENFFRWMNDVEVTQYVLAEPPMHYGRETEWFKKVGSSETDIHFAIEMLDGVHIGVTALHDIKWQAGTCVSGTMIGSKEHWGKGLGTDAKMVLLDWAFHMRSLRRVTSRVISFNERSMKTQQRCGYVSEGVLRKEVLKRGTLYDLHLLGVLAHEWEPLWQKYVLTGSLK